MLKNKTLEGIDINTGPYSLLCRTDHNPVQLGESGARRGIEVRRGNPSISARKCCILLLMPGTNHPLAFLF
jgi:hypothetical protein